MGTEYRHGIPSVAHIEAATRLGLLWMRLRFQDDFAVVNFGISEDNGIVSRYIPLNDASAETLSEVISRHRRLGDPQIDALPFEQDAGYRPIRTDGTPVDWNVLDAEAQYANMLAAQAPPQPRRHGGIEPRRFANVRPDRHGWRWWRCDGARLEFSENAVFREFNPLENRWGGWNEWPVNYWRETKFFIPTDEQGNPVSWESIAQPTPTTAPAQPISREITQVVLGEPSPPTPALPRFTADELDDVDHSRSTKLDSAPLKRGKLPTASQIGKYREVMAKRSGTAAEALKASGIDCEVAQYVLERWAGGLSDKEAQKLIADRYSENMNQYPRSYLDRVLGEVLARPLDPATVPTDDSAQRQREEREAQHLRMAALQAQLAAERAARTVEPQPEPSRFDLLECDPKANPAASIAAWETRQKRSAVRLIPQPQPPPAPHRLFEVVDAETEGLRPGAVFTALLCRALNPNC